MNQRRLVRPVTWIVLLLMLALAVAACGKDEGTLGQVKQAPQGGGDASGGEGQTSGGEGSDEGAAGEEGDEGEGDGGDIGLVQLTCPDEAVPVKLAIAHTFNWSPNRMTDQISINGTTDPNAWCMLTIAGSKLTAEPCNFTYQYDGFVKGEGATCQITGDGRAALEITGRCKDGRVYLTLVEYADDEGLSGTMSCPQAPPVDFGTGYPLSRTETEFAIAQGGYTVTASADPDVTNSFSYNKAWTLIFPPDVFGE